MLPIVLIIQCIYLLVLHFVDEGIYFYMVENANECCESCVLRGWLINWQKHFLRLNFQCEGVLGN